MIQFSKCYIYLTFSVFAIARSKSGSFTTEKISKEVAVNFVRKNNLLFK